jgi:hypothetical protein
LSNSWTCDDAAKGGPFAPRFRENKELGIKSAKLAHKDATFKIKELLCREIGL